MMSSLSQRIKTGDRKSRRYSDSFKHLGGTPVMTQLLGEMQPDKSVCMMLGIPPAQIAQILEGLPAGMFKAIESQVRPTRTGG